jgi:hypothetical protein
VLLPFKQLSAFCCSFTCPELIRPAVVMHVPLPLSLRNVEDVLRSIALVTQELGERAPGAYRKVR